MCVPDCCDTKTRPRKAEVVKDDQRHCTDVLFIFAFLGFWVIIAAIFGDAVSRGADPNKVIHGVDWQGNTCGRSPGVKNLPYSAWPAAWVTTEITVCVANCNETQTWSFADKFYTEPVSYYCLPTRSNPNGTISGGFSGDSESSSRAVTDTYTSWPIIFASGFIALAFAWMYCWLAQRLAGCMVWTIVLLMSIAGFLAGYALIKTAKDTESGEVDTNRAKGLYALGVALIFITFVFILIVFALRKRIAIAVEVVKEASRALEDIPSIMIFPLGPFCVGLAFFVFWILISLYLFSVSTTESVSISSVDVAGYLDNQFKVIYPTQYAASGGNFTQLSWDSHLKRSFAIHFFYLLWVVEFLVYFTYLVIACAIACWYFAYYDQNGNKQKGDGPGQVPEFPMGVAIKRVFKFHIGTVALGSMILAIIQFIRIMLHYLESITKKQTPSKLQRCVYCAIQCCLKCVECCCDKINKNGFVWTAIFGDPFVPSVCNAFAVIWQNLFRVAAINLVGEYVLICGKVIVAVLTTGFCGLLIIGIYGSKVSSIVVPCTVILVLSYLVATLFMALFDCTIDTIFVCFLIDEELNKGTGQMYASASMKALIDAHDADSQAYASEIHAFKAQQQGQSLPPTATPPSSSQGVSGAPTGGFVGSAYTGGSPAPTATTSAPGAVF